MHHMLFPTIFHNCELACPQQNSQVCFSVSSCYHKRYTFHNKHCQHCSYLFVESHWNHYRCYQHDQLWQQFCHLHHTHSHVGLSFSWRTSCLQCHSHPSCCAWGGFERECAIPVSATAILPIVMPSLELHALFFELSKFLHEVIFKYVHIAHLILPVPQLADRVPQVIADNVLARLWEPAEGCWW